MGALDPLKRRFGRRSREEPAPAAPPPEPVSGEPLEAGPEDEDGAGRRGLSGWVEERAQTVVSRIYQPQAGDLEERARRAMGSAYKDSADDLEQRALRAMRQAIAEESERIKEAIEHGVAIKKREVRLSLLVLIVAALVYLALYWFTQRP